MKTIDWNAVYAIGALGGMLAGMIWGLAWKISGHFARIDGKLDRVGRGQRALRGTSANSLRSMRSASACWRIGCRRAIRIRTGRRPSAAASSSIAEGQRYPRYPVVQGFAPPLPEIPKSPNP